MVKKNNSILYGIFAGIGLLLFYLGIISIFQGIEFAFISLRSLWYLLIPLSAGFGTQIGLYTSIKHTTLITGTVTGTGGISAGSMIACCSHFLLNFIPIAGISGLAIFLVKYQSVFLVVGILSNALGITILIKHKRKMNENCKSLIKQKKHLKGGHCCK